MVRRIIAISLAGLFATNAGAQDDANSGSFGASLTDVEVVVKVEERTFGFTNRLELGYFYPVEGARVVDFTECRTQETRQLRIDEINKTQERDCKEHGPGGILSLMALWQFDSERRGYVVNVHSDNNLVSEFVSCASVPQSILLAAKKSADGGASVFSEDKFSEKAMEVGRALEVDASYVSIYNSLKTQDDCAIAAEFATVPLATAGLPNAGQVIGVFTSPSDLADFKRALQPK